MNSSGRERDFRSARAANLERIADVSGNQANQHFLLRTGFPRRKDGTVLIDPTVQDLCLVVLWFADTYHLHETSLPFGCKFSHPHIFLMMTSVP